MKKTMKKIYHIINNILPDFLKEFNLEMIPILKENTNKFYMGKDFLYIEIKINEEKTRLIDFYKENFFSNYYDSPKQFFEYIFIKIKRYIPFLDKREYIKKDFKILLNTGFFNEHILKGFYR